MESDASRDDTPSVPASTAARAWLGRLGMVLASAGCSGTVDLEPDEGPALEVDVTDCRLGAVRFAGEVDGLPVDEDWCLVLQGPSKWRGPYFAIEYWFSPDGAIGPAFLAEGDQTESSEGLFQLHRAVVGWPNPLWSLETPPLCAGPGSWIFQRESSRDTPEVPYSQTHLEDLSRLKPCEPGDETVVFDSRTDTAVASFGGGFETGTQFYFSAVSGEFRILLANGAYVFARLDEPLSTDADVLPEARDYAIAEAFAWYKGEFLCAGRGTVTLREDEDGGLSSLVSVEGLGSAGTCPGTPIDGELDVFRLEGHGQFP